MTLYNWQRLAECRDLPRDWFFDHEKDQKIKIPEAAKRACRECPVRTSCHEHALRYEAYGFWALTTRGQRIRLRKKLGIRLESTEGIALYHSDQALLVSSR